MRQVETRPRTLLSCCPLWPRRGRLGLVLLDRRGLEQTLERHMPGGIEHHAGGHGAELAHVEGGRTVALWP
jgi:hypothetical protein